MKKIFEPIEWNHLALRNRLIRSATWEGIAGPDGSVSDEAYGLYEELARGGRLGIRSLPAYLLQYKEKALLLQSFDIEDFEAAIARLRAAARG